MRRLRICSLMARAKKRTLERDVTVTIDEIKAEDDRRLSQSAVSFSEECENLASNGWLLEQYVNTGQLPPDIKSHLETCIGCRLTYEMPRQRHLTFNSPPEQECLTKEELHTVHTDGKIEDKRKQHAENCERCKMHLDQHFDMYLDTILPFPS